jgi:hypothetical protein
MIQITNSKQYDLEERCFQFAKRVNEIVWNLKNWNLDIV